MKREETLVEMVENAKKSQFGLTGIKVELEAVFNRSRAPRPYRRGCDNCYDGHHDCRSCGGDGINGDPDISDRDCLVCNGTGSQDCEHCLEQARLTADIPNYNDLKFVHDQVLAKLKKYKLVKAIPMGQNHNHGYKYQPKAPLVHSHIYNDMTVDTEMTFTLALDDPKTVLLLPKIVKAFSELKDEIGQGIDVANAGMHIALLNSPDAHYPSNSTDAHMNRYRNFKKSMTLLMPALFFLGSANNKSRGLRYRQPKVGCQDINQNDHRSAINYTGGALEFRVFETCYENPEMILDDVAVALNCLRFWTKKYTRNYLVKIANNVKFGVEGSDELKRLFVTTEHIDLLNRGLRMIKPSYYSITEIKAQRNFDVTKTLLRDSVKRARLVAEREYVLYDKRFSWEMTMNRHNYISDYLFRNIPRPLDSGGVSQDMPDPDDPKIIEEANKHADQRVSEMLNGKKPLEVFVTENLPRINNPGDYQLCVE